MPIVFEPQAPLGLGITAAYAGTQRMEKERKLALEAQEQAFRQQLALAQFAASQQPSARDVWAAEQQQLEMQQRFQLQEQLEQSQLTRAEQMRLERLRQQVGYVDEQVSQGLLTREEGNEYKLMLQAQVNPLEQRLVRTRVMQEQQQTQMMQKQQAERDKLWQMQQEFMSGTAQLRVAQVQLPDGRTVSYTTLPDGKVHVFEEHLRPEKQAVDYRRLWDDVVKEVDQLYPELQQKPQERRDRILQEFEDRRRMFESLNRPLGGPAGRQQDLGRPDPAMPAIQQGGQPNPRQQQELARIIDPPTLQKLSDALEAGWNPSRSGMVLKAVQRITQLQQKYGSLDRFVLPPSEQKQLEADQKLIEEFKKDMREMEEAASRVKNAAEEDRKRSELMYSMPFGP